MLHSCSMKRIMSLWPQDHERFKNLCSAFQSIVISLAVVVGGGWTLYTFTKLRTIEKAQAELNQATFQRPVLNVQVAGTVLDQATVTALRKGGAFKPYVVQVVVTITNQGNLLEALDLTADSLFLTQLQSSSGGTVFIMQGGAFRVAGGYEPSIAVVRPGNTITLPYLVDMENPGVYLLEFRAPVASSTSKAAIKDAAISKPTEAAVWTAQTFVLIPASGNTARKKGGR